MVINEVSYSTQFLPIKMHFISYSEMETEIFNNHEKIRDYFAYQLENLDGIIAQFQKIKRYAIQFTRLHKSRFIEQIKFSFYINDFKLGFICHLIITPNSATTGFKFLSIPSKINRIESSSLILSYLKKKCESFQLYQAENVNIAKGKKLKSREFEVLKLTTKGHNTEEMAAILNLSKHTIEDYRKKLYQKFDTHNPYQLIRNAKEEGFI